jgi:4-hydroxy-tetrahydrodipicolinate synthase
MIIKGISLGTVTPFTDTDEVDVEGIERNLDYALKNGVHSVSPAATSGEGGLLSIEEYKKVIQTVVEHVNGKVSVMPGAPGSAPQAVVTHAKLAKDLGADAAYISTPAYFKPTQEGLYVHFSKILSSVDIPFVIYNAVHRTAVDMSPEVVQRLYEEFPNFAGYKVGSLLQMSEVILSTDNKLPVIAEDFYFLPALAIGASAVGSVTANIVPKMMRDIYDSYVEGNMEKAREMFIQLVPLMELIGTGGGGSETSPAPIKEAMNMLGLAAGKPRLPLVPVTQATRNALRVALAKLIPSLSVK